MTAPEVRCVRLTREYAEATAALLARDAGPCFCRYWHFSGDKNQWLARCAHEPERSRAEFLSQAEEEALQGVVALSRDGEALGWMKLTHSRALEKLYAQRVYRALPCFSGPRADVYAIGCFVVDQRFRRSGIARALLRSGLELARQAGARAVEAFPRGVADVSDAELWTGPFTLFMNEGFEVVNDFRPYPVLRRELVPLG